MARSDTNPWLHRYATFVAFCTFLLIIAGALVTGNDAGLSVPDWPTSFGTFRMPRMVGGVKFEHGHRMIAGTVGILTIILAVGVWIKDSRRWVRWVGFAAVMAVVAQAVLGGITVLFYLPVAISTAHATLAQIFFCLAVSLTFFTGRGWKWNEPKVEDPGWLPLRDLAAATTGAILLQLILGAVFRHGGVGITPHLAGAGLVSALTVWVVAKTLQRFPQPALSRPALLLAGLVLTQLFLGMASLLLKVQAQGAPQPLPPVVNLTTAHVAVGALVLITSLCFTYQTFRFLSPRKAEKQIAAAPERASA